MNNTLIINNVKVLGPGVHDQENETGANNPGKDRR